jgi:hypothetical protein
MECDWKMEEIIRIPVLVGVEAVEKELDFKHNEEEEMIYLLLDGNEVCRFLWESGLESAIHRMIELWGTESP